MTGETTAGRDGPVTRRRFLLAAGTAAVGGLAGCGSRRPPHGWIEVNAPGGGALYDVVATVAGPHAVGEDGRIVGRRDDEWTTVTEAGPSGNGSDLNAAAVTDDGRRVWAAGSSGAVARYDTASGTLRDLSAPLDKTSTWEALAVTGRTGSERVYLVNSSGELLPGRVMNGSVRWGAVSKPNGGESVTAIDFVGSAGYLADTAGGVYRTEGNQWTPVGVRGADTTLTDLSAVTPALVNVVAEDGSIYLYTGYNWLSLTTAEEALHSVDRRDGRGVAGGVGGTVFELDSAGWTEQDTPTGKTLHGVAVGRDAYADVAVGANGTVMERFG